MQFCSISDAFQACNQDWLHACDPDFQFYLKSVIAQ